MPATNSYTFDASTGEFTPEIQLEKHPSLNTLHVNIEEHNHGKGRVRVCPHNPPRSIDNQTLRLCTCDLENGHLVEMKNNHSAILHVVNSHKIKPRKDSEREVIVLGVRSAMVKINHGHSVTIHNSSHKWVVGVIKNTQKVEVLPA